jgi:hypothetical protein
VDYHIGVITTDPSQNGILRTYDGPPVAGCDGCTYLTNAVTCDEPDFDVEGLQPWEAELQLAERCESQLVFRKLISAGIQGSAFEEGFRMAARALGLDIVDADTGLPTGESPPENAGFLRDDASLYVIYVSDEEEGAKADGDPVRYYHRLFEGLKGRGDELRVSTSAIVGWPLEDRYPVIRDVCPILETTFDDNRATDDPRAALVTEALTTGTGCVGIADGEQDPRAVAETGGRYIELACRTRGVVANICDENYSVALDRLGANAAGLQRRFILSKFRDLDKGEDCELFTVQDPILDCDENGSLEDEIDGPICVKGVPLGSPDGRVVAVRRSEVSGWTYEPQNGALSFRGQFVPAPGSTLEVQYRLYAENDRCRQ